jgi:hypothetical protein
MRVIYNRKTIIAQAIGCLTAVACNINVCDRNL